MGRERGNLKERAAWRGGTYGSVLIGYCGIRRCHGPPRAAARTALGGGFSGNSGCVGPAGVRPVRVRITKCAGIRWAAEGGGPYGVGRWIFGEFGVRRAGRCPARTGAYNEMRRNSMGRRGRPPLRRWSGFSWNLMVRRAGRCPARTETETMFSNTTRYPLQQRGLKEDITPHG